MIFQSEEHIYMSVPLRLALSPHLGQVVDAAKINKAPVHRRDNKRGQTFASDHIRLAYYCRLSCYIE